MEALRLYFAGILELPPPVLAAVVAVFASLVGSFVNVCIWRIPRGESVVLPPSHCTACGHRLGVIDLVPFFSQIALGSKCRYCGTPYSWRYLFVELLVMLLWLASFFLFGPSWAFLAGGAFASLVVVLVGIRLMAGASGGAAADGDEPDAGDLDGEDGDVSRPGEELAAASSPLGRRGLSFLEILFTTVILVSVIGPFLSIMRSSYMGAEKNRELIVAYNLAAEKIEELKVLPVAKLAGDWKVYVKGERLTDNIFADEFFGKYAKMDEDEDFFHAEFSDVLTEADHFTETVQEKFERNFRRYHGFDYRLYPRGYEKFDRVTRVERVSDEKNPANPLVKVVVTVTIRSRITKGKQVVLATYLSND